MEAGENVVQEEKHFFFVEEFVIRFSTLKLLLERKPRVFEELGYLIPLFPLVPQHRGFVIQQP